LQTVEIKVPDDWTQEQIEAHLNPQADTSIQDGLSGLSAALGEALKSIDVKGVKIPETKLDGVEKTLKSIETAIKAIKTPELPDNSEFVQAMGLVSVAIDEFKGSIKYPEAAEIPKPKKMNVIRKRHVVDGQEVHLIDSVEYEY